MTKGSAQSGEDGAHLGGVLNANEWVYHVEGAAHMVLCYAGEQPQLWRTICRVGLEGAADNDDDEYRYIHNVVLPRLGREYVDSRPPIQCPPGFLQALARSVEEERPKHRRAKRGVNLKSKLVSVEKDYTRLFDPPCWCLELKPKYSHLAVSKLLPTEHSALFSTPFFSICFREDLPDGYDPADALSGDITATARALACLHAQRHRWLRVFLDGALLSEQSFADAQTNVRVQTVLKVAADTLVEHRVITERIRALQRLDYLSSYGVKLVSDLLRARGYDLRALQRESVQNPTSLDTGALRERLSYTSPEVGSHEHCAERQQEAIAALEAMSNEELTALLQEYMLAAVAKDCSVMITLTPRATNVSGNSTLAADWMTNVAVVDLGPKAYDKLDFWHQRDSEVIQRYSAEDTPT